MNDMPLGCTSMCVGQPPAVRNLQRRQLSTKMLWLTTTHQVLAVGLQHALNRQHCKLAKHCPSCSHQARLCTAAATTACSRISASHSACVCCCWCYHSSTEAACMAAAGAADTCGEGKVHGRVPVVGQANRLMHSLAQGTGWEADAAAAERHLGGQLRVDAGKRVATCLQCSTA